MEIQANPSHQVLLAIVDRGKSVFHAAANIRQMPDAVFRVQVGLGQSNKIQLYHGTGNAKFLSWLRTRLSSDVVISVPIQGTWKLSKCTPTHYTGPVLSSKGGSTSIEELVLSSENIVLHK